MSHFSTVETKITDLVALKKALDDLGYSYTEAEADSLVKVRGYEGQTTGANLCIKASKTYDIGVVLGENGAQFVSDWWGVETTRGVSEQDFLCQVKQRYAYHKVMGEITARGYTLEEEKTEDNQIHIRVRTWG